MEWWYREKMHRLHEKTACAANVGTAAKADDVPDTIALERARRLREKEKNPTGLQSKSSSRT